MKKKYVIESTAIRGSNLIDISEKINEFLKDKSNLDDFDIIDINYSKISKYFKEDDNPKVALILYKYSIKVRRSIWKRLGFRGSGEKSVEENM